MTFLKWHIEHNWYTYIAVVYYIIMEKLFTGFEFLSSILPNEMLHTLNII